MRRKQRQPEHIALALLRTAAGWNMKKLAQAAGFHPNRLTALEKGDRDLSRAELDGMAGLMGFTPADAGEALVFAERVKPHLGNRAVDLAGVASVSRPLSTALEQFLGTVVTLCARTVDAAALREEAPHLWTDLSTYGPADQQTLVRKSREYRGWALCELICHESVKAAADDAGRALELANLALLIAEGTPGDEAWRLRVQGYAWAHVANSRRVQGNLRAADRGFARAKELWKAGEPGDPTRLLEEARVLGMESSLRREQRQLATALALVDQAMGAGPRGRLAVQLLISRANVLELQGAYDAAVAALEEAAPLLEEEAEPRALFAQKFSLANNLCHLGRQQEAAELLPEVRRLTVETGLDLDAVRLRWLEGRVAAGLGRRKEAITALAGVRHQFVHRGIGYDSALTSLELAVLYLEEGRTAEVKTLAREMNPIFEAQGVHPEMFAALRLFIAAAEKESVTVALTRRLVRYLYLAKGDPSLRFEPGGYPNGPAEE